MPSEDEGEDDLMGVAEAPTKDDRPAIRLLEELWACGCVRYVPTPLTACDVYDLQAFCSLLVDGHSSCDKLPYSCIAPLGNVEHEHVEHDVGRLSLSVPVGRSGVSMSVGRSDQSACNGQDQEREGAYMPIGDRWVWVSRPRVSYDDIDGIQLDNKESWEGMKTEVKAVDSLQVGLLRSRSEVDHYQAENPGCRVIKSRWVLTQSPRAGQSTPRGERLCSRQALCFGSRPLFEQCGGAQTHTFQSREGSHADMGSGHLYCIPVCECCPTHRSRGPQFFLPRGRRHRVLDP